MGWRLSASAAYYKYATRDRTHDEDVASEESQKDNFSKNNIALKTSPRHSNVNEYPNTETIKGKDPVSRIEKCKSTNISPKVI